MDKDKDKSLFIHFFQGAISGMVGLTLSHPFDTIKTSIQDKKPIQYNPKFLYRGITAPFFGVGLEKSIVFGVYNNMMKYSNSNNQLIMIPVSGGLSGFLCSFVVTPVERIKILLQTNQQIDYKKIYPKFLFRGLSSTFSRETPGFAIYFTVYEHLKRKYYTNKNQQITTLGAFCFGGFSGFSSWIFIYPQDSIKTRIQASQYIKKTFISTGKEIYSEGGLIRFYKGFHFALMRAIPLHAGTFATMEFLRK